MATQSTACTLLLEIQQLWSTCAHLAICALRTPNSLGILYQQTLPVKRLKSMSELLRKISFLETFAIQKLETLVGVTQHVSMESANLQRNWATNAIKLRIVILELIVHLFLIQIQKEFVLK